MIKTFLRTNFFYIALGLIFVFSLYGIFRMQKVSTLKKAKIVEQLESSATPRTVNVSRNQILLAQKKPIKCNFSAQLANSKIAGTTYKFDDKVRTDMTAPTKDGKSKLSHTIFNGDDIYTWYDGETLGIKINRKSYEERLKKQADKKQSVFVDVDQEIASIATYSLLTDKDRFNDNNLACEEWQPEDLKFVVPPSVTFIDGVEFYDELDRRVCAKCNEETTEASRLLCRKTLQCD